MGREDNFHLGVKGLIRNSNGELLLLKVNKERLDGRNIYWDIPGGRIHRGETAAEALQREIKEETGLNQILGIKPFSMVLSNIRIPLHGSADDVGLIPRVFICQAACLDSIKLSEENVAFNWFAPSNAAKKLKFKYPPEFIQKLETFSFL